MAEYHNDLDAVNEAMAAALGHLAELRQAMAALDQAGRYNAAPSRIELEPRRGRGEFMRLYFTKRPGGGFYGPTGKRKVYIGVDPARQAEARRLAENARRWERLYQTSLDLETWLQVRRAELETLADRCQEWPTAELLGPMNDAGELDKSPNKGR